jgi:4-amino-4-deoxy-L-arabinose transferase-like glycosyltransferase
VRVPVILFLSALAVRILAALVYADPAYPDSFYYVNTARQLAAGQGFQVDYVWNFVDVGGRLPADPRLPIPSNAHWMPLAELIQVPFIWLLGATPLAYGLPFWLAGATAAPLTWWIGRDAGLERSTALAGGALVAVPLGVTPFLAQPDNFALFMPLGALALWLCARSLRREPTGADRIDRRLFVAGGLVVGMATLSRNDGILLGVPFALAFLAERWRLRSLTAAGPIGWGTALACLAAFLVIVAPWYLRQLAVFGSLSPSAANGRILWITDYAQLFSISTDTSLGSFLAQGPVALVASRAAGLVDALKWFAIAPLLVFLVPFLLVGAWSRRRDPAFAPWFIYAVTLFGFSALLFAVHVDHGTFLHSAVALVPHAYLLAAAGIAVAVRWTAERLPHWDARRATRNFTILAVLVALVGAVGAAWKTSGSWRAEAELRAPIVAALRSVPATDRLMSPDPGSYRYHAGLGGIITPNDPLPVVEEALRAYQIRWLVLEKGYLLPSLVPLLTAEQRPAWLSAPIVSVPSAAVAIGSPPPAGAPPGGATGDPRLAAAPAAALYAVCLAPTDPRCAP